MSKIEKFDINGQLYDVGTDKTLQPLTFTGAVSAEYDGTQPVSVEIPAGGGGGLELIEDVVLQAPVKGVVVNTKKLYKQVYILLDKSADSEKLAWRVRINGKNVIALSDSKPTGTQKATVIINIIGDQAITEVYTGQDIWGSQYLLQSRVQTDPMTSVEVEMNGNYGVGTKMSFWGRM